MLPIKAGIKAIRIANASPVINFLIRLGILGVVAIGSYYLIRTLVRKWDQDRRLKKETAKVGSADRSGKINLIAQLFRKGFFPYGEPKWGHVFWDGTDEEAVYEAAAMMHKYGITMAEVSRSYQAMNPRNNLLTDLQRELSADELARFYDILQGGSLNGLTFNRKIWAYRSTPVLNRKLEPVGSLKPGTVIGNMSEILVTPGGKNYVSFYRKGRQLFVNAADLRQKQAA
jgi:hypothetical protein